MNEREFARAILEHVKNKAHGTPLDGKVGYESDDNHRRQIAPHANQEMSKITSSHIIQPKVNLSGTPDEHLECGDSLYFFYRMTVVRWPRPVTGETKSFFVKVLEPGQNVPDEVFNNGLVPNFEGEFSIDSSGNLFIRKPKDGSPVTVVVLGNPGSELGANTKC